MGAVGSAVGTGVGVLIALAFMLMIYHMNRKIIRRRIERDRSRDLLETGEIFKIILFMVTPVLLSTFAYNASALINQTLYLNLMQSVHNASYDDITIINGIYDTEAVGLSNIPIAIASAMASAILPSIAGSFETKKKKRRPAQNQRGNQDDHVYRDSVCSRHDGTIQTDCMAVI